jgi:hypothetical protein
MIPVNMIATDLDGTLNFIKGLPTSSSGRIGILIGSRALRLNLDDDDTLFRTVSNETDYDIIIEPWQLIHFLQNNTITTISTHCSCDQLKIYKVKCHTHNAKYEFELVNGSKSNELIVDVCDRDENSDYVFADYSTMLEDQPIELFIPSRDILYGIKMSHLYFNIHWQKTIEDIHYMRQIWDLDLLMTPIATQIIKLRQLEVESRLGKNATNSHINLEMSNDDFFKQSEKQVKRVFEHDFVHQKVAFYEEPMFLRFKDDPQKAKLEWELFQKAPLKDQLYLIQEECMVLALERYLFPLNFKVHAKQISMRSMIWQKAYMLALERICTTLWKGPFRDFAIDHYPQLKWQPADLCEFYEDFDQNLISESHSESDPLPNWVTRPMPSYDYFCSESKAQLEAPTQYKEFLSIFFNDEDETPVSDESVSESEVFESSSSSDYNDSD